MRLDPIVERLLDTARALRFVGVAAEFTAAQDALIQTPAAYVLPSDEAAGENELIQGVSQEITVRFAVMLVVRNVKDARGEAALADLETVRMSVFDALLNWPPNDFASPIVYGGGSVAQITDRNLWWQEEFVTTVYLRSV